MKQALASYGTRRKKGHFYTLGLISFLRKPLELSIVHINVGVFRATCFDATFENACVCRTSPLSTGLRVGSRGCRKRTNPSYALMEIVTA
jgi:hypothetical protein